MALPDTNTRLIQQVFFASKYRNKCWTYHRLTFVLNSANFFATLQLFFCSRDIPCCFYHTRTLKYKKRKQNFKSNGHKVWVIEILACFYYSLRKYRVVFVVLLGSFLQLRSSLSHKRSHLVDNKFGVWILWRRDFKQAISTFALQTPRQFCHWSPQMMQ